MSEPFLLESETIKPLDDGMLADAAPELIHQTSRAKLYKVIKDGVAYVRKVASGSGQGALLKREWEIGRDLQHPGIVRVTGFDESQQALEMEYVDGRTLTKYLLERPSAASRRRVFRQLLDAAEYLHKKGIVHNDLSPQNILVTRRDNSVKIIDFGFADNDAHELSQCLGSTIGYSAPELLAGKGTDSRSDIYSLGVILGEMFPKRYRRIVRRCLSEEPKKRYDNVSALRRTLKTHLLAVLASTVLCIAAIAFLSTAAVQLAREIPLRMVVSPYSQPERLTVPNGNAFYCPGFVQDDLSLHFKTLQTSGKGGYDTTTDYMAFGRKTCGRIFFSLNRNDVKRVELRALKEFISGVGLVSKFETDENVKFVGELSCREIKLNPKNATFAPGRYAFVVPMGLYNNGF